MRMNIVIILYRHRLAWAVERTDVNNIITQTATREVKKKKIETFRPKQKQRFEHGRDVNDERGEEEEGANDNIDFDFATNK